jgi:ribosomal-protein-serine acetyltransferase
MRPVLFNELVKIRCYDPMDVALLFQAARESATEVSRWLPWCHPDYSMEESLEWILKCQRLWGDGLEYHFVVFDRLTETLVGGVGLNQLDPVNRLANLGYWVRTAWTGRGVATAAARLAARFGFEELGLIRLEITVALGNTASQRVAEKVGGACEGLLRKRLFINGQSEDALIYSLLASEWSRTE